MKQGRANPALIGGEYMDDSLMKLDKNQKNSRFKPFGTIHLQGGHKYDDLMRKADI